jgi:hypothetical protein
LKPDFGQLCNSEIFLNAKEKGTFSIITKKSQRIWQK